MKTRTMLDELLEEFDALDECDGGAAAGGGDSGGGDAGGAGTSTADVLGPGGVEDGHGCMGKDDFHVPFPVMPCLFRWPANWLGGSGKKRKKNGKTVSTKNPYVRGMKTVVAEEDAAEEDKQVYLGTAKAKFDEMTQDVDNVFTGVLTFNKKYRLAWLINDKGLLEFYKPIQGQVPSPKGYTPAPDEPWRIYHTVLEPRGVVSLLDVSDQQYPTEDQALTAIWREVQSHRQKLAEHLRKMDEAKYSPRDIMNWEAHGRDPRYFPKPRGPEVNAFALQNELKRRFPGQFENVQISDRIGRWTARFTARLPEGRTEIRGQQRIKALAMPQIDRIMAFLRMRGVDVNSYDVTAVNA